MRMRTAFLLAASLALAVSPAPAQTSPPPGGNAAPPDAGGKPAARAPGVSEWTLRARWTPSGAPAEGVGLRLWPADAAPVARLASTRHAVTGADGSAAATLEPTGFWILASDRGAEELRLDAREGGAHEIVIELPEGPAIEVRVRAGEGTPPAGARIWMAPREEPAAGQFVGTVAEGATFVIRHAPPKFLVAAFSDARAPSPVRVVDAAKTSAPVELELGPRAAAVAGTAKRKDGTLVPGALLWIGQDCFDCNPPEDGTPADDALAPVLAVRTDAKGRFELPALRPRLHAVRAFARGLSPGYAEFRPGDSGSRFVTVELEPDTTVQGQVLDATGAALTGATVELRANDFPVPWTATTDALGWFRLSGVPARGTALRARAGALAAEAFFPVEAGGVRRADLTLR